MAATSRFPHLALPFAIVGAAGGWLSAGLAGNPLLERSHPVSQGVAALVAALCAALTGFYLMRSQVASEALIEPEIEPGLRPYGADLGPAARLVMRQIIAVLIGGAATGAIAALLCDAHYGPWTGAFGGLISALAFVPVCLMVVAAARRSQRARLGSLVAASDRRAIWAILATALALTTLEALPDWPAAAAGEARLPVAATMMLMAAGLVIALALTSDVLGLRRARRAAFAAGLEERDPARLASADLGAPTLDLGLGDELRAQVARTSAAYRGGDRTVSLVQGDPAQALAALRRAMRRGAWGLLVVAGCGLAHLAARGEAVRAIFDERRCDDSDVASCVRLADAARARNPARALRLYEQSCSVSSVGSCLAAAEMHDAEIDKDAGRVPIRDDGKSLPPGRLAAQSYWDRACRYGDRGACMRSY